LGCCRVGTHHLFCLLEKDKKMNDWIPAIERLGLPTAILMFVGLGLVYVLIRLFGKRDGIIPKVVDRHVLFIDKMDETIESIKGNLKELSHTASQAHAKVDERDGMIEGSYAMLRSLMRAALYGGDIIEEVCKKYELGEEAAVALEMLRKELSNGKYRDDRRRLGKS